MKDHETFWNRIYIILKCLPEKEGQDGWEYLDLNEREELKNIRKNVLENDQIEPGQVGRLEQICIKMKEKIFAERN